MRIERFFDEATWTLTYLVDDGANAVVIDSVRDYEARSGRTSWRSAEKIAAVIDERKLAVHYVIDTHAHADHLSGMPFFEDRYGARTVTGARVGVIQEAFCKIYGLGDDFPVDGRQFDVLLDEGEHIDAGSLRVEAMHTPGHTPAHMSWRIDDAVFVGDTLFMPDYGTARCDFPGGSAAALYDSIQRIYRLPDATRLFVCHDYLPNARRLRFETTVGEQKQSNVQLDARTTLAQFVASRNERDASLEAPALILPSIQVNIRAGELPPPDPNGVRYLRIPLNVLGRAGGR
jgi:glyoxylase-like metal-dependent hydrolase (beta-lactamase superfamily II)